MNIKNYLFSPKRKYKSFEAAAIKLKNELPNIPQSKNM